MELDFDLIFVAGLVIGAFAIPAFVSAYSDKRRPKFAVLLALVGGGMAAYAVNQNPGAYSVAGVPDLFVQVIGTYLN